MEPLTFGSLFAGVGGFDLGFERAGMVCKWQVEVDAKCNEVLAHHWSNVRRFEDIRSVGRHNLEPVGVISGGFPCVGLSVAGRRAGLADERSGLWWEMLRVIEELRPTWVVIENVPGLRSSWSSAEPPPRQAQVRDFAQRSDAEEWAESVACDWEVEETSDLETILASLGQLGYWWAFRSLDAQYHDLAQRRERVFIVGHSGDVGKLERTQFEQDVSGLAGLPAKVLFEPEGLSWDSAPSREAGQRVTAPLKASSPSRRAGGSWPIAEEFVVTDGHALAGFGEYRQQLGTLRASGGDAGMGSEVLVVQDDVVKHDLSGHNQRNDPSGEHFIVAYTVQTNDGGEHRRKDRPQGGMYVRETDTSLTLGSSDQTVVAFDWQSGGDVRLNVSSEHTSAMQASQTPAVLTRMGVRRLTVTECERLQGFPETKKCVIIDICLDHQKTYANVEIRSLKLPRPVGSVEKTELLGSVRFADKNLSTRGQLKSEHVPLLVHINCGGSTVEIHSQEKLFLSVNTAARKSESVLPIPIADFVRLLVGLTSTAERIIISGEAESQVNGQRLVRHQSGEVYVMLSGNEITQHVKDAAVDLTTSRKLLKSIISSHSSTRNLERELTILCSYVLSVITGYIHPKILDVNSFRIKITTNFGWTDIDGASDTARYRQLGNAVAVPVAEWIGRRIAACHKELMGG